MSDIVTLEEAKLWLRIDHDDENELIQMLIDASRQYIFNATGREWPRENTTARLVMLALIAEWYENRGVMGYMTEQFRLRPAIQSMITQLQYEPADGDGA